MTVIKMDDSNKENIIAKYNEGMNIIDIAKLYNVAYSTIYFRLIKWGVKIRKHGGARRKKGRPARPKRKFSKAFLARRAEITRLNEGKVEYISFKHSTEDQRLIANIIRHPIIG